jgi:uracil-DNA glycosylase
MPRVPGGKARLHLLAEKAMGLASVPVPKGVRRAAARPTAAPASSAEATGGRSAGAVAGRSAEATGVRPAVSAPSSRAGRPGAAPVVELPLFPAPTDPPFVSAVLATEDKRKALALIDEREVKGCEKCGLCAGRTNTVFGEGDVDARLMFVGEGPGENEDLTGRPFVGRAGELLDKQIMAMGLRREQVYIANIVKCRPPGNRAPGPDESSTCASYLLRQLEIVRPTAIVTLGLSASQFLLTSRESMGRMRGRWHEWRGIGVMPTYHPAYLLRAYTDANRKMVWEDLQQVMSRLGLRRGGA